MAKKILSPSLLIDSARGIYTGKALADGYDLAEWGIEPDDIAILEKGPQDGDDGYWGTLDDVIDKAKYQDEDGQKWTLYMREGDIFAIPDGFDVEAWETQEGGDEQEVGDDDELTDEEIEDEMDDN